MGHVQVTIKEYDFKFIVPIAYQDPDAELHHDINRRIRRDASRHHSSRLTKMTQPLTFVVLSTGLENFKEIRAALTHDSRAQLLAGGNDPEQLYEEIVRLKPAAAIIALGGNAEQSIRLSNDLTWNRRPRPSFRQPRTHLRI